ncbi:MAG: DsrE family protein [Deltaproteobacteria bacterium]|nr:DsrE family protein [Deltaproteobacteria bacterium]
MKKSILVLSLIVVSLLPVASISSAKAPGRDGVFIHVTHGTDDPHRLLMALRMAELMAEDKAVLMYFDINGVDVLLKGAPDVKFKDFPSSSVQIQKLLSQKVRIMACPACLKAAGKSAEHLAAGIELADKKAFFSFTSGRILSLDY